MEQTLIGVLDAILEAIRAALEALEKWIKKHKR